MGVCFVIKYFFPVVKNGKKVKIRDPGGCDERTDALGVRLLMCPRNIRRHVSGIKAVLIRRDRKEEFRAAVLDVFPDQREIGRRAIPFRFVHAYSHIIVERRSVVKPPVRAEHDLLFRRGFKHGGIQLSPCIDKLAAQEKMICNIVGRFSQHRKIDFAVGVVQLRRRGKRLVRSSPAFPRNQHAYGGQKRKQQKESGKYTGDRFLVHTPPPQNWK